MRMAPRKGENASRALFLRCFFEFDSSEAYLDCLRSDPPKRCGFHLLSITEGEDSVCS